MKIGGKKINVFYHLSLDERELAKKQIKENARGTASFYVMVIISTIIITSGLIVDNSAVVIGGMIIAPLIWPLLALAIAAIHWQKISLRKNLYTLIKTLIVVLLISFLMGLFYPLYELSNQMVLRTEPNIIDLIIAVAAGLGGAFAAVYTRRSPTIFGVAIAVALVPPLCTAGILLGNGNFNLIGGAILLFLTNLVAILVSAMLVFIMAKFGHPKTKQGEENRNKAIIYALASLFLITLPLGFLTWNVIDISHTRSETKTLFTEMFPKETIKNLNITKSKKAYTISGEIYSSNNIEQDDVKKFTNYLSQRLNKNIYTTFTIVKVREIGQESTIN